MKNEANNWKKTVALFMAGQGITMFGSMMVHYAVMWHITLQMKSGIMMTLITIAGTMPMFLISPFSGVWADRYNKKYLINIADGVIAAVSLIMALVFSTGVENPALLLICLVMRSFGQGVQSPTVNALIPTITPEDKLTRVNGINGSVQSFVMIASPMAGAAVLSLAPITALLFIDVITAAIGIGILFFLVKTPKHEKKDTLVSYFDDIKVGLNYIKNHAFVKKLLLTAAVFNFMLAPAAVMTPLQVARNWGDDIWRLNAFNFLLNAKQRLAIIEVVFFAGMLLGGVVMGAWGGLKNRSHSMALSISLFGAGAIGLGVLPNFWAYAACMCAMGLVLPFSNAPLMSTLQLSVESSYMGRVFSVLSMVTSISMPVGMLIWGPLGDIVNIDWLLVGTGAILFVFASIFIFDKALSKAGAETQKV